MFGIQKGGFKMLEDMWIFDEICDLVETAQ